MILGRAENIFKELELKWTIFNGQCYIMLFIKSRTILPNKKLCLSTQADVNNLSLYNWSLNILLLRFYAPHCKKKLSLFELTQKCFYLWFLTKIKYLSTALICTLLMRPKEAKGPYFRKTLHYSTTNRNKTELLQEISCI